MLHHNFTIYINILAKNVTVVICWLGNRYFSLNIKEAYDEFIEKQKSVFNQ